MTAPPPRGNGAPGLPLWPARSPSGHPAAPRRPPQTAPGRRHTDANRSSMETAPSRAHATQRRPALVPLQGKQRDRRATSLRVARLAAPHRGRPCHEPEHCHAPRGGLRGRPPPAQQPSPLLPPLTPVRTPDRPGPTPEEAGGPEPGSGTQGPGQLPPPTLNRRNTGPGQETRRSMNRMERPLRRLAQIPRAVRAPHGQGRGKHVHRRSASAHRRNGHAAWT